MLYFKRPNWIFILLNLNTTHQCKNKNYIKKLQTLTLTFSLSTGVGWAAVVAAKVIVLINSLKKELIKDGLTINKSEIALQSPF